MEGWREYLRFLPGPLAVLRPKKSWSSPLGTVHLGFEKFLDVLDSFLPLMKKTLFTLILLAFVGQLSAQTFLPSARKPFRLMNSCTSTGRIRTLAIKLTPRLPRNTLGLYIAFKRKVAEAEALGRDTLAAFLTEYNTYYRQLLKPYLTDKTVDEGIVKEAYARMATDVRAAHIMLDLPENALPEDTAKVYKQILAIRDRLNRGESFETIARQQSSDSYSAVNGGDLGYFNVFNMVYPFENACYNAEVGQVVGPVRAVRLPPDQGAGQASRALPHDGCTYFAFGYGRPPQPGGRQKDSGPLQEFASWGRFQRLGAQALASQDQSSLQRGGQLPPFGLNQMLPEFEDAAFALAADGDFSSPLGPNWDGTSSSACLARTFLPLSACRASCRARFAAMSAPTLRCRLSWRHFRHVGNVSIDESAVNQVLKALEKGKSTAKLTKPVVTYSSIQSGSGVITQTEFAARAIDAEARRFGLTQ